MNTFAAIHKYPEIGDFTQKLRSSTVLNHIGSGLEKQSHKKYKRYKPIFVILLPPCNVVNRKK